MLLVGWQEGHPACKSRCWYVGGDDLTEALAAAVATTSVILSSNAVQNGDIPVPARPVCPGKWSLNERRRVFEMYADAVNALHNVACVGDVLFNAVLKKTVSGAVTNSLANKTNITKTWQWRQWRADKENKWTNSYYISSRDVNRIVLTRADVKFEPSDWVLVCCWWHFDLSLHLIAPVVTTTSITLSSNKIQNGDILVPANPGPPGKWPLKRREFSQGNAAADLRVGGRFISTFLCSSSLNSATRELLKSTTLPKVVRNKMAAFLISPVYTLRCVFICVCVYV